jgi:hypothetical protein
VSKEIKGQISEAAGDVSRIIKQLVDDINRPLHYTSGAIEVTDYIQDVLTAEEFEGFCKGVILQYVSRSRLKGGVNDIKKAIWYANRLVAYMKMAASKIS